MMEYFIIFLVVFTVVGLKGFQQKVMNANHYKLMALVGGLIYAGEGSAIIMVSRGTPYHVLSGSIGAAIGVVVAVFVFNRFFKSNTKK